MATSRTASGRHARRQGFADSRGFRLNITIASPISTEHHPAGNIHVIKTNMNMKYTIE